MFDPHYTITPILLNSIKRIAIEAHELNKLAPSDLVYAELLWEAKALSTFASTSIEGNPLPLTEVKRLLKHQPPKARQSEIEVLNYNQVLSELNEDLEQPFTADRLLHIHQGVTTDLLPQHQTGQWRREPVVIYDPRSKDVVFLPPDHEDVPRLMGELVEFVRSNQEQLDPVILAGLFHKQFVIVHPFVDGNGRVTRLATKLLLARLGINTFNLFSFENFYNKQVTRYFQMVGLQGDYYKLSETGVDFTEWLEYFAGGILDELLRVRKVIEKAQSDISIRLMSYHQQILQFVDQHGSITDKDYSKLTERAKATRTLDFNNLIKWGFLVREGRGRGTYYRRV